MKKRIKDISTIQPRYNRSQLKPRIVHLGFGAFHRAHQAVYADILAADHNSDWGYCEVNLIGGEQQIIDLKKQDNLFTVSEMSENTWKSRVIGIVKQALHASHDGIDAVLSAMTRPEVAIVSLTVTEKGYCHFPSTGQLNSENSLIQDDLKNPNHPLSAPGVIVAALARRKAANLSPFSVLSCDNIPENGRVTHNVVTQFARLCDPELAEWIEEYVSFPSTMVDRIVPVMTDETFSKIEKQTGVYDPAAVACEPFRQWVIEDNFVSGRPNWEKAGAELVSNVLPYEEMKIRMLNGSHSFLAYLGYLAGFKYINECMKNKNFFLAARNLMLNEHAPTLRLKGIDLQHYADSLIQRYKNPALNHRTWQIAMDGSQKIPQRMLDSVRWHLKKGSQFPLLALGIAAWIRYVGGLDEQGNTIEIVDPLYPIIKQTIDTSQEGLERVKAVIGIKSIFDEDLAKNEAFIRSILLAYNKLTERGAQFAVNDHIAQDC